MSAKSAEQSGIRGVDIGEHIAQVKPAIVADP
jgi:hypothetical protein